MEFFDFLKTEEQGRSKAINLKDKVVGRHSQLCFVKRMLGKEVTNVEQQEASNKDIKERDGIFGKLEKIDAHIKSKDFLPRFDFSAAQNSLFGDYYKRI